MTTETLQIATPPHPAPLRIAEHVLGVVAALQLLALMLLTCVDVVGRYFLNRPLTGAFELTELTLGALIFSSLPLVALRRQHVTVDLFDRLVPAGWRGAQSAAFDLVAALCTAVIAWRLWIKAAIMQQAGETTAILQLAVFPLVYYMAALTSIAVAVMLGMAWTDASGWIRSRTGNDHD